MSNFSIRLIFRDVYGEGCNWAMCIFIHLLKERPIFQSLDYATLISALQDQSEAKSVNADVLSLVKGTELYSEIFDFLTHINSW